MTPDEAYMKALDAKERLPELEPVILQNACYSYYYARDVIKGRWDESC